MTRDFNKERRNDSRPPFRNSSPNNNKRDERTPRPARPRLNREVVDRAWESGAPQRHADYRPRDNNRQGGPYGNSSRSSQGGQYSNSSRGPQRGPYGNSPRSSQGGQYGNSSRSAYNNYDNKPRTNNQYSESDNGPRRDRNDRGFQDRRQGTYQDRRDTHDSHNARDTRGNQRDGYRENRYDSSSHFSHQDRRPNNSGSSSYGNDGSRFNRREDYRERDNRNTPGRPQGQYGTRGSSNRPYQERDQRHDERPYERRDNDYRAPWKQNQPAPRHSSFEEPPAKFEGDYESFNERRERDERPSRPPRSNDRLFRGTPNTRERRDTHDRFNDKPRERHVTPLPDGRVIKGSRPEQRRNARFWTDVSQEASELMNQVSPVERNDTKLHARHEEISEPQEATELSAVSEIPEVSELSESSEVPEVSEIPEGTLETSSSAPENESDEQGEHTSSPTSENEAELKSTREAIRRRTRAASAVVRGKKEKAVRSGGNSTNMKPSQRGFKWLTP